MSRIGKSPVAIPAGVTVRVEDNFIHVEGKMGKLSQEYSDITVKVEGEEIVFERPSESKDHRAKHGLYRALVNNMVVGVSQGWTKDLS
jgi:LSU ribosomal protein L6P